ncbi:helix-turn-helix domain-containing protein [Alkaliflexus imshenetskii]|uniref:helix-turn-helix domain-containing protein n=1 Tax=Alkaliflexus imshenetskii TaxID=286730 RepID=UPI00047B8CC1|nr:AraC family transcriptional regulator [Alkaliflexus imshenetskii]
MNHQFSIHSIDSAKVIDTFDEGAEANRHEFEELLIGVEGGLEHFIDFRTVVYDAPYISFVSAGKLHRIRPILKNDKCFIWVIRFQPGFLPDCAFKLQSYYPVAPDLKLNNDSAFRRMVALCEMMDEEMNALSTNMRVVQDLLRALFSMIEAARDSIEQLSGMGGNSRSTTFSKFLDLLEMNFRNQPGVEFYASELGMTARNLNNICHGMVNRSVSELIEERRMAEGKILLVNTDKTVGEIGFDLGYNEKSCFTTVFKKTSGQTPTSFRKQMRKMLS